MESKLFTFINGLAKVSIFPFFYFATFFLILFMTGYATDSFSRNYGEAIEGMALGMMYLAPALLLILIPVSLIILKLTRTMYFLKNDWFLVLWGGLSAGVGILLLLGTGQVVDLFYFLF